MKGKLQAIGKALSDVIKQKDMKASCSVENVTQVKKIVFTCAAGIAVSAMGAAKFSNSIKSIRPDIYVTNSAVDDLSADTDIVICQNALKERAAKRAPQAELIVVDNLLSDPALDALCKRFTAAQIYSDTKTALEEKTEPNKIVMLREGIRLGQRSVSKEAAIRAAGELLEEIGCVNNSYIDAMLEREKIITTYMGLGVAVPHGMASAKHTVKQSGMVLLQYPQGIDFGEEKAQLIVGIAGVGDEHLKMLVGISDLLEDEQLLQELKTTDDVEAVLKIFCSITNMR